MVGSLAMLKSPDRAADDYSGCLVDPAGAGAGRNVTFGDSRSSRVTFRSLSGRFVTCDESNPPRVTLSAYPERPDAQGRPPDRRVRRPGGVGALAARQPRLRQGRVAED